MKKVDSIIQTNKYECYLCGCRASEEHHIFNKYNRKKSTKYGLTVYLCPLCHRINKDSVHVSNETNIKLKKIGQIAYMDHYNKNKDEFREIFSKNYL